MPTEHRDRNPRDPVKVSLGLGRNSVGLLVGLHERSEPIDAIVFADTGDERRPTYAYLPLLQTWLARVGYPPVTVVKNRSPRAGDASLSAECLRKSVLPSLAYGKHSCSLKWKVEPQRLWTRAWPLARQAWARGGKVINLIGYDAGHRDLRRASRGREEWPPGQLNRYPLIEWGWTLDDCVAAILRAGLPIPVKSACVMCPASKKDEIAELVATEPDRAAMCVEMEARARRRGLRSTVGLGRTFGWTEFLADHRAAPRGAGAASDGRGRTAPVSSRRMPP